MVRVYIVVFKSSENRHRRLYFNFNFNPNHHYHHFALTFRQHYPTDSAHFKRPSGNQINNLSVSSIKLQDEVHRVVLTQMKRRTQFLDMSFELAALFLQTAQNVQEFVSAAAEVILLSLSSPIDDVHETSADTDADDETTVDSQGRQVYYAMPLEFFEGLHIPIVNLNELAKQGVQVSFSFVSRI